MGVTLKSGMELLRRIERGLPALSTVEYKGPRDGSLSDEHWVKGKMIR